MPLKNLTLKLQPNITPNPRKSPRFLPKNQDPPLDPKTPEHRPRVYRFFPGNSPLSSVDKGSFGNVNKNIRETKCGLRNLGKLNHGLVSSGVENSGFGVRRSSRLSGKVNVVDEILEKEVFCSKKRRELPYLGRMKMGFDFSKGIEAKSVIKKRETQISIWGNADEIMRKETSNKKGVADAEGATVKQAVCKSVTEKKVTRRSVWANADEIAKKSNGCKKGLSGVERDKDGFNLGERNVRETKIEKRVTRGSIRGCADEITKQKFKSMEELLGIERNSTGTVSGVVDSRGNSGKELIHSCGVLSAGIDEVNAKGRDIGKSTKTIGVKRKRNQDGEDHGWTQDQELALQKAYFAAKPTPNFWKRVAKLVPGKSAQDCFNKVHADNLTPPQPQPRSRATKKDVSSFSLSASKLLKPEDSKMGKVTSRKHKGHLAQKTVRQLLEKHYNVDQGHEADLFSVLEPNFIPCISYCTPKSEKGTSGLLKTCLDKSNSALKKPFSRVGSINGKDFVSPPVLKPVKNKALHEKYIDHLHIREAKRRKANGKNNPKKEFNQKAEAIKVLKDALVLDAKDFIHRFQDKTDSATKEYSDDDDAIEGLEDDEEDEL